jgi:hypothetical protein
MPKKFVVVIIHHRFKPLDVSLKEIIFRHEKIVHIYPLTSVCCGSSM